MISTATLNMIQVKTLSPAFFSSNTNLFDLRKIMNKLELLLIGSLSPYQIQLGG